MPVVKKHHSNIFAKFIIHLFKRYHLLIFFVGIVSVVGVAVYLVNGALDTTTKDPTYISPLSQSAINQKSLERLKSLHSSGEVTQAPTLPSGRISPFGE